METCPRCQTRDQNSRIFCKKCGYKLLGPTFGLLQYIPDQRGHQRTLKEKFLAELTEIKKGRTGMAKEKLAALLNSSDLVTYSPFHLVNLFSQKWAIFTGSIILSLMAAIIYCSAIHCNT